MADGVTVGSVCSKCSERPAAKGQRWCSRCRKGKGRTRGENGGERRGENVPKGENARRTCSNCEALAAEVASLKRQLSAARAVVVPAADATNLPVDERHARTRGGFTGPDMVAFGRQFERNIIAASQNAHKATMTPHGPRCQGICCRSARAEAGE